jgi:diadenosine tetraphosphatase ApaH/serine/threonine PP2A family protein phosphatase
LPDAFVPLFEWHASQLSASELNTIAAWPLTETIDAADVGRVLFCHATPRDDNEILTATTPDEAISPLLANVDARAVICGHTHRQFERMLGDVRLINAGSVGMPGNGRDAEWLLITDRFELRRTSYDLGAAAARMRRTDYPRLDEFLTAIGAQ